MIFYLELMFLKCAGVLISGITYPLDRENALQPAFPVFQPGLIFKTGHWTNALIYKPIIYTDKDFTFIKSLMARDNRVPLSFGLPDRLD